MGGVALGAVVLSSGAASAPLGAEDYHLEAQDLGSALRAVGRLSGREVMFAADAVPGKKAPRLDGTFTPEEAIVALLKGSGLGVELRDGGFLILGRRAAPEAQIGEAASKPDIVVTGTRIRGALPSSPTITQTEEQIRNSGINSLGDYVRSLPQGFSGGQNPGVVFGVTGETNQNLSSASSINLRGLGQDATLTLLNGHRLAFNGAQQAIDISAIPLAAVDRIEIITDGASAIYGSDAVGGVANVLLKRSYDGVSATARFGASTDGGNVQQQYSIVAGATWSNAGFMATYDYEHDTPVISDQRSYTSGTYRSTTLLPFQRHHSAILTGYLDLGDTVTASFDALYSSRASTTFQPLSANGYLALGYRRRPFVRSFSISPKIEWQLPQDWLATLLVTYGEDKTDVDTRLYASSALNFASVGFYRNRSTIIEANAEGPVFALPGGDVRLAVGGGYRSAGLDADLSTVRPPVTTQAVDFSENRRSYYGFGEIYLPIISPDQQVAWISRLSLSGAVRYEDYPGIARIATPKLGAVYAPSRDLDLKFSWGRSFKAPTLYQQNLGYTVQAVPTTAFGSAAYPANAAALYLSGGNTELKPERALTWAASVAVHPTVVPALKLEASLFHIRYRNRITQPITSTNGLLTNPIYQSLVTLMPNMAEIDEAVQGSSSGVQNNTAFPYDPANVVAIVDSRYLNVARQTLRGVDISANYRADFGEASLTFTGAASYLHSRQVLTPTSPAAPLAGTLFNPPHWRGRAGLIWEDGPLTLSVYGNVIGGVTDNRLATETRVDGMKTLDLTTRYRSIADEGLFSSIDVTLSALNILNDKPSQISTSAAFYPSYDSTNYSVVGRFVSFSITKHW